MTGVEVALAALGIMATTVGVLVWLLKKLFNQNDTTLKEGNKANLELAKSINKLAIASEEQTRVGRERDAEQREFQKEVLHNLQTLNDKADKTFDAVSHAPVTIEQQHVEKQVVQQEVVESKSH